MGCYKDKKSSPNTNSKIIMNEWMNFILPNNTANPVKYLYTLHTFTHIHTIHTSANSVGDVAYR